MPRRYPAGGSYRGQYNSYQQQPNVGQYQSAFNPIPIEFLQEQLRGRQGQYDQAFAGTLAAKDAFAQEQVGLSDIASKNQLINDSFNNIDKMVEEKYGGDWSRAAKEVARTVTQTRANPFWNAQKEVEEKRDAYQSQIDKFGSKSMQFGPDPRQMSTLDEQGRVRSQDQFAGRVVEQGEWANTARTLLGGLSADVYERFDLAEGELQGYIQGTKRTELTRKKIEKMASDPAIQEAFLREHPEFREGFEQGDERLKSQFGLQGENLQDAVKQQLLGVSASAETERIEKSITADWRQKAAAEAAAKGATVPLRDTTTQSDVVGHYYEGQIDTRNVVFNKDGGVANVGERTEEKREASAASYMPVFNYYGTIYPSIDVAALAGKGVNGWRDLMNEVRAMPPGPQNPLGALIETGDNVSDFIRKAKVYKDEQFVEQVVEQHPELDQKDEFGNNLYTREQAINMKTTADEKQSQQSNKIHNFGEDWQKAATTEFVWDGNTFGSMFNQEMFVDGQRVSGDDKQTQTAKLLGYKENSKEFNEAIKASRISNTAFTGNTPGEQVMTIKDADGNNRTIEIAPSNEVQELSSPSWMVAEIIRSGGQSDRIQEFEVHGQTSQSDGQGGWFVPSTEGIDVEGNVVQIWYHVNSDIVPVAGTDNMQGEYQSEIQKVIFRPGEDQPQVVPSQRPSTLESIVDWDKSQVKNYIPTKRLPTQKQLSQ